MKITAEIAYYPIGETNFKKIIEKMVVSLSKFDVELEYTTMSTIAYGEHSEVVKMVKEMIEMFFIEHHSILEVKFSNACRI